MSLPATWQKEAHFWEKDNLLQTFLETQLGPLSCYLCLQAFSEWSSGSHVRHSPCDLCLFSHSTLTPGRNPVFLLPPWAACSVEEILEIIAPKTAGGGEHYQLCLNPQCPKLSISSSSCEQQVHLGALQIYRPLGMWPQVSETLGPLLVAWGADQDL